MRLISFSFICLRAPIGVARTPRSSLGPSALWPAVTTPPRQCRRAAVLLGAAPFVGDWGLAVSLRHARCRSLFFLTRSRSPPQPPLSSQKPGQSQNLPGDLPRRVWRVRQVPGLPQVCFCVCVLERKESRPRAPPPSTTSHAIHLICFCSLSPRSPATNSKSAARSRPPLRTSCRRHSEAWVWCAPRARVFRVREEGDREEGHTSHIKNGNPHALPLSPHRPRPHTRRARAPARQGRCARAHARARTHRGAREPSHFTGQK